MPVGFTTVTSEFLQDATGTAITGATAYFQPVSSLNGQPLCFRAGGNGGATSFEQVSVEVNGGALTIQLCDTALTFPTDIGYSLIVRDDTTRRVLLCYPCIQPTGATWSLDSYDPVYPSTMVTIQPGPQGQPGTPGGVAGSVFDQAPVGTIDGTNVTFTLPGAPSVLFLTKNGVRQTPGVDYTLVGATITFLPTSVPVAGDGLWAFGVTATTAISAQNQLQLIDTVTSAVRTLTVVNGTLELA